VAPDAFCWKICFCCVKNIPAPTPPTSTKIPSIDAIIFPVLNFFFGEMVVEMFCMGGGIDPGKFGGVTSKLPGLLLTV